MAVTGLPQLPGGMKWHVRFAEPVMSTSQPGTWTSVGTVEARQHDDTRVGWGTFLAMSWEEPASIEQKMWHVAKKIITNQVDVNVNARENFKVLLEDLSGYYPPNTLIKAL